VTNVKRTEIRRLVKSVIDHLGSTEIAIDERHTPKLYARFLKGLLNAPMAKVDLWNLISLEILLMTF
jgi:hypothetical protein